jgi:hypothetical protein
MTEQTVALVAGAAPVDLTGADVATLMFENVGAGDLRIARGTGTAPALTVPHWTYAPEIGDRGAIGDVFPGGAGARLWAWSAMGTSVTVGWA